MALEFSSEPIIHLKDISVLQGDRQVLSDVTFDIKKGEFVYLIGRTGSGKTSLLKILYADLFAESGELSVAGYDLMNIKRSQIPYLRRKIGVVFQDFQLFFDRSVYENLLFVLKATGWTNPQRIKQQITDVLMRVGLESSSSKMPHQLSGGEQQRVVIARALLNDPHILIADEPTGNLDPEVGEDIMKLFLEINKSGMAILMATHNYSFIDKYPARVLTCVGGKISDSTSKTSFPPTTF